MSEGFKTKERAVVAEAFRPLVITEERHAAFLDAWEECSYSKGTFLVEPGKVERYFYVVIEGVQAIYFMTREGDKKVIGFSFDGSFSGVYDSFLREQGSNYFLEVLTDSRMMRINKEQYDSWFETYPEFDRWGRIVHQELLIGRGQREIELITMSAQERFEVFMNRCPPELLRIPQKYLASYLNMTPETFSRMRARIS